MEEKHSSLYLTLESSMNEDNAWNLYFRARKAEKENLITQSELEDLAELAEFLSPTRNH